MQALERLPSTAGKLHQALVALRKVMLLIALTATAVLVQATILAVGSIDELALTTAAWSAVALRA